MTSRTVRPFSPDRTTAQLQTEVEQLRRQVNGGYGRPVPNRFRDAARRNSNLLARNAASGNLVDATDLKGSHDGHHEIESFEGVGTAGHIHNILFPPRSIVLTRAIMIPADDITADATNYSSITFEVRVSEDGYTDTRNIAYIDSQVAGTVPGSQGDMLANMPYEFYIYDNPRVEADAIVELRARAATVSGEWGDIYVLWHYSYVE